MTTTTPALPDVEARAETLFDEQRQRIYRQTDRVFAWVMVFQWVLGILFALWISPRTWDGAMASTHVHVWAAVLLGGLITAFPVALAILQPGTVLTRHAIAVGQTLTSALLIHLTGGRIETHFHVFGSLAFLAFYRDWRVLVTASSVVLADHFVRGMWWPQSVYGVMAAPAWRVLEHGAWVVFEDVVLIASSQQSLREMRSIAQRQAQLEAVNTIVEQKVQDRTAELAASEEAVEAQRRFLRQVIDINPNFVFVKDRDGRFTLVNEAVAQAYGTTTRDLIGRTDADFNKNPEEVEAFRRDDCAVMESLQERVIPEEVITDAHGRRRWLQTVKRPLVSSDGTAQYLLGVSTDVTERKRTEDTLRQSQKMEAVGRLAGGIAHDFNNLLQVISGFSDMVLRDLPPGHKDVVRMEQVRKAAERASALTAQLLTFTRKKVLEPTVVEVDATVTEMELMLRRLIGAHIELRTALDTDGARVKVDPGQLGQVVLNLAVNARDAMPLGGRLTIETRCVDLDGALGDKTGPHVMIAVTDTGHGMDAETRAHIFEPFFTTKEQGKGTGLGLATVYGIVEQAGGQLAVDSEVERGTTFRVYLPRAAAEAVHPARADADEAWRGTETVLLVEDEVAVRALAREILLGRGYKVVEAEGSAEALALGEDLSVDVDLLLTDVVMPGLSGPQLALRLQSCRPDLPVLFMSGYAEGALLNQGLSDRPITVLPKPFTAGHLARVVRQALDGSLTAIDRRRRRPEARA